MPTALIERKRAGGMCVNEGCTPTESMAASGPVLIAGGVRRRLRSMHGPDRRRPAPCTPSVNCDHARRVLPISSGENGNRADHLHPCVADVLDH